VIKGNFPISQVKQGIFRLGELAKRAVSESYRERTKIGVKGEL